METNVDFEHMPYDEQHLAIKGKTHSSVRYFAKKFMLMPAPEIIVKMTDEYPLLMKYFKPEVRKIQDIAYREKKITGVEPRIDEKPKAPKQVKVTERTLSKFFDTDHYQKVKEEIASKILAIDALSSQRPGVIGADEPVRIIQMV
jgi:deoxyribodipyrimidine photolyase-like uncharacterized protein